MRYAVIRPRFAPGELGPPLPARGGEFGGWDLIRTAAGRRAYAGRLQSARAAQILARIRATPPGFVRSYGDVAPGAPRLAGAVLHACEDPSVPWHRVVRADGSLAKGDRQRLLLEAEGVPFRGGRVDMRIARLRD
jgi:alkylated DNA nucleotide flippase Atl1